MTHCKTKTKQGKSKAGTFWYQCEVCGMNGKGKTEKEAQDAFRKSKPKPKQATTSQALIVTPNSPEQFPVYIQQHMTEMVAIAAPFMQRDKPALNRMIKKNTKYIMQNKNQKFMDCWKTDEGARSIIEAYEDALSLGAELPAMGSIIPFGGEVEFVPGVEAYDFALRTGKTAPFKKIKIDPVHKNDQYECFEDEESENFMFRFKSQPIPRGEVIGVVVRAEDKQGNKIGRIYDTERLIQKAKQHSKSYKAYLLDLQAFEYAQSEGTIKEDANGREYIEKVVIDKNSGKYLQQDIDNFQAAETAGTLKGKKPRDYAEVEIPKKGGGTWTKKIYRSDIENPGTNTKIIYRDDLQNPYDGADRPEMLRKTAGKSFFSPFIKIRNSVAAMEELRTEESEGGDIDSMLDGAIDTAMDNLSVEDTEYEIILEDGPDEEAIKEAEEEPEEKAEQKKADAESDKQDDLF
ncbi:hypothetical protein KA005_12910 [bacterium]|nr:hypothetical protein [bacterium]